jgi:hypothetical protein
MAFPLGFSFQALFDYSLGVKSALRLLPLILIASLLTFIPCETASAAAGLNMKVMYTGITTPPALSESGLTVCYNGTTPDMSRRWGTWANDTAYGGTADSTLTNNCTSSKKVLVHITGSITWPVSFTGDATFPYIAGLAYGGVTLFIDGVKKIDSWQNNSAAFFNFYSPYQLPYTQNSVHQIELWYYHASETNDQYLNMYICNSGSCNTISSSILTTTYTPTDSTPPSITTSTSVNIYENTNPTQTITTNESATISLFGGSDKLKFTLNQGSSTSATLGLSTAPNFEAPTDVGSDNTYQAVIRATDSSSNSSFETITVTVLNVAEVLTFQSLSLSGSRTIATLGTVIVISAVVDNASKITFLANQKRIAGCVSKATTGSVSTFTATCSWKPSIRGTVTLSAAAAALEVGFSGGLSQALNISVIGRTSLR